MRNLRWIRIDIYARVSEGVSLARVFRRKKLIGRLNAIEIS